MIDEAVIDEKTQSGNGLSAGNGLHASDQPLTPFRSAEGLPAGIREGNAGLLSLKDIEAQIGDGSDGFYGRLRRFADAPGIGELLGAVNVPGAKGARYEPRSAEIFRRLLAASTAKEVTPATAVAWLKLHQDEPSQVSETAIAEKPPFGNSLTQSGNSTDLATRGLMAVLAPVVNIMQEVRDLLNDFRTGKAQIVPPAALAPDRLLTKDRLLTAEQAAELLACNPRSVSRYVAPVRPRTWRESDCLRYIERLGEALRQAESEAAK